MAAAGLWSVICLLVASVLLLVGIFLLIVKWGHPDDKNQAILPKAITAFGLFLAFANVLVVPYDVAFGEGSVIRVDLLWQITYVLIAVALSTALPFAFFFYENDVDPDHHPSCCQRQSVQATIWTIAFIIVFFVISGIIYALSHDAHVPITSILLSPRLVFPLDSDTGTILSYDYLSHGCTNPAWGCINSNITWSIPVTFPIFLMGFMAAVGWVGLALFGGVGLISFPLDMLTAYFTRPRPISTRTYFEERQKLGERSAQLIQVGQKLKDEQFHEYVSPGSSRFGISSLREGISHQRDLKEFEKHFYDLKKDYQMLVIAYKLKGGNPLWYFGQLLIGVISLILSFAWLYHIINSVFLAQPASRWLNEYLEWLDTQWSFLGSLTFAIFSFYLLICVIKGNMKLGLRLLIWRVYPMEYENTMMNAFLFNTWLVLISSVAAVQLATTSFQIYTRNTQIQTIFGVELHYLYPFDYLYKHSMFLIIMFCMCGLTIVATIIRPRHTGRSIEQQLQRLSRSKDTSIELREPLLEREEEDEPS